MFNFKGSFSVWCKFLQLVVEFQVFVVEPDLISDFPRGKVGVYAVLRKKDSFFMGNDGFFLSFREKVEAFF